MLNNLFVSSSVFKVKRIDAILEMCREYGITNLELGSNIEYFGGNLEQILRNNKDVLNYLIHNYFPRPKDDFVLNLSSDDKDILSRSINLCEKAIELSASLNAPFYSVHAGFAFHALPEHLGACQVHLKRIPHKLAYAIFVDSVGYLAKFAFNKGVRFAVENNVVQKSNLINGQNEILLLADIDELMTFIKDVGSKNLFFLIDLGHLKISSVSLGFDKLKYLDKILPHTIAFHISENDSENDAHLLFDQDSWFINTLRENTDKVFVIEVNGLGIKEILAAVHVLKILNQKVYN